MKKSFFHGTTPGLRIAAAGIAVGLVGFTLSFLVSDMGKIWLSLIGLGITIIGFFITAFGIVYLWATEGEKAIKGSYKAANDLGEKIFDLTKKNGTKKEK